MKIISAGSILLINLALILCANPLVLGESTENVPSCISRLDRAVEPGRWLKIITLDGQLIEGYLASVSYESYSVILDIKNGSPVTQRSISFDDTKQVVYKAKGVLKPEYIFGGFIGGAFIGAIIGGLWVDDYTPDPPDEDWKLENVIDGILVGGAVGSTLGVIISLGSNQRVTIKCNL